MARALADLAVSTDTVASANAAAWDAWWAASAVDLGPERSLLEGFWYGAQYMLRAFAKSGPGIVDHDKTPGGLQNALLIATTHIRRVGVL